MMSGTWYVIFFSFHQTARSRLGADFYRLDSDCRYLFGAGLCLCRSPWPAGQLLARVHSCVERMVHMGRSHPAGPVSLPPLSHCVAELAPCRIAAPDCRDCNFIFAAGDPGPI